MLFNCKHIFHTVLLGFQFIFGASGAVGTFGKTILERHNYYRSYHEAPALTWNKSIADAAKSWVSKCNFTHDARRKYGENLYMIRNMSSVTPVYLARDAAALWYSEVNIYDYNKPKYNHFTQVVWKNTKMLGCAWKYCKIPRACILSCKYYPHGNIVGKFAQNVRPFRNKPTLRTVLM